jgi:hypothetical protein
MATTMHKQVIDRPVDNAVHSLLNLAEKISEWFWIVLSFSLFVVLGPFSAPVVLIVLCKLGLEASDNVEPESISPR